jgi:hypothetical protein
VGGIVTTVFTIDALNKTDSMQDWSKATNKDVIVIGLYKALIILLSLTCYPLFWGLVTMFNRRRRIVVVVKRSSHE